MPKINVAYIKSHPVMFGSIVIVFGLLFWLLINRGGGSSGVNVSANGPSDAQVAAGAQMQMAQLGAQTQVSLAQLSFASKAQEFEGQKELAAMELAYKTQELAAQTAIGGKSIEAQLAGLALQLHSNETVTNSNNSFMLGYARQASDAATQQLLINAALQRDMSAQQLEAFKFGSTVNAISTLKEGKRDNALALLMAGPGADAVAIMAPNGGSSGGFNPLALLSPVAAIAHAV